MSKPLVLLGAGGHAAVLADVLMSEQRELLGVVDPALPARSRWRMNLEVLGDDRVIDDFTPADIDLVNGLGYLPGQNRRREIYLSWRQRGYVFAPVVHPAAILARDLAIAPGAQILAGCVINSGAAIGENVLVNTGAIVEHDCRVADHCHLAPGAIICGGSHLGESCFIGAGATVIHGQKLADRTVLPAGRVYSGEVR